MPDLTMVLFAVAAWMALALLACALCVAAGRADRVQELGDGDGRPPGAALPPYVVDTGRLRARLRGAGRLIAADQLAVLVDVGGTDAVVAVSRPLVAAAAGECQVLRTPIRADGRQVAVLQAVRRPGAPAFEEHDRRALEALAAGLGHAVSGTDHDTSRPSAIRRVTA